MLVLCPTCGKPVVEYNPNCKKHTAQKTVHNQKPAHKRPGPKVNRRDLPAPEYVKAILHVTSGIHPSVLAEAVHEVTEVNFQKIFYCTSPRMYEAGELFVALAYFGLGLTQDEIAEYAHHSSGWVRLRLRSLKLKLTKEHFAAKLRRIALYIEAQRSNPDA
jgi:hypothetical protein